MESSVDFDPYKAGDIKQLIAVWLPLTFALNSLSRCMGQGDIYPFVLSPVVIEKLGFVQGNRGSESPHRSDSVGAGVEPTAALPMMMVPRGYRAITGAWVLETGGRRWLSLSVWTCRWRKRR